MGICERLREERQRLGKTQTDFAAIGGVQKRAQINYESGDRTPDAEYLAALAEAGVDVLYVLSGRRAEDPPPVVLTDEEATLVRAYRALDARAKAGVLGMIGGLTQGSAGIAVQGDVGLINKGPIKQKGVTINVGRRK